MSDIVHARMPEAGHIELLQRRGAALARVPRQATATDSFPAVVFALGPERYALDARHVIEVLVLGDLMPLPGARAPLFGLTHWRGQIIPVLDLRGPLGVKVQGVTDLGRLVVVAVPRRPFGILADVIDDMIEVDALRLGPLHAADDPSDGLVTGTTDDMTLVLDAREMIRRYGVHSADNPR